MVQRVEPRLAAALRRRRTLPARRMTVALQAFSISVVSGMAALAMLRRTVEPVHGAELDLLKHTLVREMSGSD